MHLLVLQIDLLQQLCVMSYIPEEIKDKNEES
jgi:hypothetical protein